MEDKTQGRHGWKKRRFFNAEAALRRSSIDKLRAGQGRRRKRRKSAKKIWSTAS